MSIELSSMSNQKILYVTTEMFPYQEGTNMASEVNKMALKMHQEGNDVRVFMPRFGLISERKYQLYFIDNDEYFKRKSYYTDEEGKPFEDNDERAIFFTRGVIETIKKLNWVPDVIHLNGWMSSFVAIYLKNFYKSDTYFQDTKLVLSVYNEKNFSLGKEIEEKLKFDGISNLKAIENPTIQDFVVEGMDLVDLVVKGDKKLNKILEEGFKNTKTPKIEGVNEEGISEIYK